MNGICFATGILIGTFATSIVMVIALFRNYIKGEEDMFEAYEKGYKAGKAWREVEVSYAQEQMQFLKTEIARLMRNEIH